MYAFLFGSTAYVELIKHLVGIAYIHDALEAFMIAVASMDYSLFHTDHQELKKTIKSSSFWHLLLLPFCRTPKLYGALYQPSSDSALKINQALLPNCFV
jgi:hypothetical protein